MEGAVTLSVLGPRLRARLRALPHSRGIAGYRFASPTRGVSTYRGRCAAPTDRPCKVDARDTQLDAGGPGPTGGCG